MDPNLFPMPGPSKRRDDSDDDGDNFHKKPKTDEEIDVYVGSKTIDDLPEEILITLFKYLPFQDRLQAQKVCNRWHELGKTQSLQQCVKLTDISVSQFHETVESLSSCVLHFELKSQFLIKLPNLPQFLMKLSRHCPSLKTLILENVNFERDWTDLSYDCVKDFGRIQKFIQRFVKVFLKARVSHTEEKVLGLINKLQGSFKHTFFKKLQALSLSAVNFDPLCYFLCFTGFVLPELTVLDLSNQKCIPIIEYAFLSTLTNLKELYLCGWKFNDPERLTFLKYLKKLRVLDLGNCLLSNSAISVLVQNSAKLEELYLCFSSVQEIEREDNEDFFPCLQSLCLKNTSITERNIRELLTVLSSLKFLNVSSSSCGIAETSDIYKEFKEKCHFSIFNGVDFCNHFSKRKNCCK